MKIQRVWAKKLHGNLNFDISLNSGINLLVGINGSGKTSVLNVINWITSSDIATLSVTEFDEVGIEIIEQSRRKIVIAITQEGTDLNINCTAGQIKLHPINVNLRTLSKDLRDSKGLRQDLKEHYGTLAGC